MTSPPGLSVVIPAWNEARRISSTLERIAAFLASRGGEGEVLVIDDGSHDGTAQVVAAAASRWPSIRCLSLPRNRGKGAAVRTGVLAARHGLVLVCDADLSTPLTAFPDLYAALGAADVVIGSRACAGAEVRRPQHALRRRMGQGFNRVIRLLGLTVYRDTQCGFKLWRREAAREVFALARVDGYAFDVETLLLAERLGYRVAEVGVPWVNDPDSRVRLVSDSLAMLLEVLRIRCRHLPRRKR